MKLLFLSKKKGMTQFFGGLESLIMEVLWRQGELQGRDIQQAILKKRKVAYTTTLTVLGRLSQKGLIHKARDPQSGRIHFAPALTEEEFQGLAAGYLVQSAFRLSPDLAVSAFVDVFSRMSEADQAKLGRLMEARKNGDDR